MLVSVTALGAGASRRGAAAGQIVDYLSGAPNRLGRPGSQAPVEPQLAQDSGVGAYFSDAGRSPGRWRGTGAADLGDRVDREMLSRTLLGQDPRTGVQLVSAQGSSGRAHQRRETLPEGGPDLLVTAPQAAAAIGVHLSYVQRVAAATAKREMISQSGGGPSPDRATSSPGASLPGVKVGGEWRFRRADVDAFIATRREAQVVMAYDVTFSAPKSLSIIWATGDPTTRRLCEDAFEAAVARAVSYLEANAIVVGRHDRASAGTGMIAASYRHDTSRALEPQLHEHVVIANMATGADGRTHTLDGRALFAHATTAGYLAAAELQQHTNRAGIAWTPTRRGIANVAGVGDDAIRAMSTRREQVLSLTRELGSESTTARQKAALVTRAAKDRGVDPESLRLQWRHRLAAVGFTKRELAAATSAAPTRLWTPDDTRRLYAHLSGARGVTELTAVFDRRDVIQSIVDYTGGRLNADQVEHHADRWLHSTAAIELNMAPTHSGWTALTGLRYTTPGMIATETAIVSAWERGREAGAAVVPADTVNAAISEWERSTGLRLGADQVAMVRAICGSGDRFQAVIGPAGTGKTAALDVAARAWHSAGYRVLGAAINGTATDVLARTAGISTSTVASLTVRLDTATTPVVDARTVVIIDEASTLDNRHHARLVHHIERSGAAMRAIGDPAQHGAVEAGGMWTYLVRAFPERVPALTVNRRQGAPAMGDVRAANADLRAGRFRDALERLDNSGRVTTAATLPELLDCLVSDWYGDRVGGHRTSRMIAEHHHQRRALNTRAQDLLRADGTLHGPGVRIGEATFHVGDEVIARAQNRNLRYNPADRRSFLRNGAIGTVEAITGNRHAPDLLVQFDHKGTLRIPNAWIAAEVRPGVVGGLAPAYAVTSHAAQGDTYHAGRMLATDTSTPEAVYVGITRGTSDARLYAIRHEPATAETDPQLPRITDNRTPTEAVADALARARITHVATVADPDIAHVAKLLDLPLHELEASEHPHAQRAAQITRDRIAYHAFNEPSDAAIAALGPRDNHPKPELWDRAVTEMALNHARPTSGRLAEQRVRDAVLDAQSARLTDTPTSQLAAERRRLTDQLAGRPAPDEGLRHTELEHARARLHRAQQAQARAEQIHAHATTPRARRKDPDGPEATRRLLESRTAAVNDARRAATFAERRVGNIATDHAARQHLLDERHVIDHVIEARVADAIATPAPYLLALLGERTDRDPQWWNTRAAAIERYRHRDLGIERNQTLGDEGIDAAIGRRPNDPSIARRWDDVYSYLYPERRQNRIERDSPGISR